MCGMVVLDSKSRAAMILRMGPFSTSVNFGLFAARPPPVVAAAAVAAFAAGAAAVVARPLGGATGPGGPRPFAPCALAMVRSRSHVAVLLRLAGPGIFYQVQLRCRRTRPVSHPLRPRA